MTQESHPHETMSRFLYGTDAGLEEIFSFKIADAVGEDLKVRFSCILEYLIEREVGIYNVVGNMPVDTTPEQIAIVQRTAEDFGRGFRTALQNKSIPSRMRQLA